MALWIAGTGAIVGLGVAAVVVLWKTDVHDRAGRAPIAQGTVTIRGDPRVRQRVGGAPAPSVAPPRATTATPTAPAAHPAPGPCHATRTRTRDVGSPPLAPATLATLARQRTRARAGTRPPTAARQVDLPRLRGGTALVGVRPPPRPRRETIRRFHRKGRRWPSRGRRRPRLSGAARAAAQPTESSASSAAPRRKRWPGAVPPSRKETSPKPCASEKLPWAQVIPSGAPAARRLPLQDESLRRAVAHLRRRPQPVSHEQQARAVAIWPPPRAALRALQPDGDGLTAAGVHTGPHTGTAIEN